MRHRRRPSPALLVAIVALAAAAAGPAGATALITGRQIATHTITRRNIAPSAFPNGNRIIVSINTAKLHIHPDRLTMGPGSGLSADNLDGLDSGAFARACAPGAVRGYAHVRGVGLGGAYTGVIGKLTQKANCTGGVVEARRIGVGHYRVRFPGIDPAVAVPILTPIGQTARATAVRVVSEVTNEKVWEVELLATNGVAVDGDFNLALL